MIFKDGFNTQYIMDVLRRRLWYVVLPFFIVSLAAVVYCIKAPKIYKSSTLVLIQPQEVPTDYVRPIVRTDARSRLNILSEQVMSRPNLEGLIKKYNLYPEVQKSTTMYDAVEIMREHIGVDVRSKGRGDSPASFEVSYMGADPVKVRDVATAIANLFIDYNLKLREDQTAGTTTFIERELARVREQLREKEELVRQFKTKYMGMLPENMENNYRILQQLQQQLASLNDTIQQIENRKLVLRTQWGKTETLQVDSQTPLTLDQLRQQIENLRSRYTERHPDVVRLATVIARMEQEHKEGHAAVSASFPGQGEVPQMMPGQREDLLSQLKMLDGEMEKLREERRELDSAIEEYRRRLENGPKLEQMYVDLRRDYEQVDGSYQSLLQRKLQAVMAQNLERTQKGEQFRILEPANLPEKPFKPNISKVLFFGLVLALACSFGIIVLREQMDQAFWDKKELESFLQLPVLVSIPAIHTGKDRSRGMFKRGFAVSMLVCLASALFYALLVLWTKNAPFFL